MHEYTFHGCLLLVKKIIGHTFKKRYSAYTVYKFNSDGMSDNWHNKRETFSHAETKRENNVALWTGRVPPEEVSEGKIHLVIHLPLFKWQKKSVRGCVIES